MDNYSKSDIEDQTDVPNVGAGEVLQNRNEVQQLVVVRVREPTANWYGVLRVEDIGGRGIVNDDSILQITSNLREILQGISRLIIAV